MYLYISTKVPSTKKIFSGMLPDFGERVIFRDIFSYKKYPIVAALSVYLFHDYLLDEFTDFNKKPITHLS